jgi:hypothetical protein
VEVVRGVLLVGVVRLVSPVDADLLNGACISTRPFQPSMVSVGKRTDWWTRRPFKVCMARSAAPGSSYSTKP